MWVLLIGLVLVILFSALFALLPYLLAHQFVTSMRFTCVGLSFNLADSIVGGFTPVLVLQLIGYQSAITTLALLLTVCGIISCLSYLLIRPEPTNGAS